MVCPLLGGQCVKQDCALWKKEKEDVFNAECAFSRIASIANNMDIYLSKIVNEGIDVYSPVRWRVNINDGDI